MKHGDIEDIGTGTQTVMVSEPGPDIWSASGPIRTLPGRQSVYVRQNSKMLDGSFVTVMVANDVDMKWAIEEVERAWNWQGAAMQYAVPQRYVMGAPLTTTGTLTFQQIQQWADEFLGAAPKKSDEEKLAWLKPSGKKEFL